MYAYYTSYRNFKCAHNFSSDGLFVNPGKAAADGIGISDNWHRGQNLRHLKPSALDACIKACVKKIVWIPAHV